MLNQTGSSTIGGFALKKKDDKLKMFGWINKIWYWFIGWFNQFFYFLSFGSSFGGGARFRPLTPFYPTKIISPISISTLHIGQVFSISGHSSIFFMVL